MQILLEVIERHWDILSAIGLGFLFLFRMLRTWLKRTDLERLALTAGMQAIIRQDIIDSHARYTERGSIPFYSLENAEKLYKAYEELGGNSFASELMRDIRELPVQRGSASK